MVASMMARLLRSGGSRKSQIPLPFLGFSRKEIRREWAIITVAGTPRPSSLAMALVGYRRAMLRNFSMSSSVQGRTMT
jgi:hypothetical protein